MPNKPLHIQLFGEMHLRLGDEPVPALSPMEGPLLAYLLLHQDAPRQELARLLWPGATEAEARDQLRDLLDRLRRNLPDADRYLRADRQTVGWRAEASFTLDVAEFEGALAEAAERDRAGQRDAACEALERAVALYRGDLLPGCYDDWIAPERLRLLQRYLQALEQLVALLEGERRYERAIEYAHRLLRRDPLHERAYRALVRLYARAGDRASALRAYHTCATTLQRELNAGPGPETQRAYQRLLGRDSAPGDAAPAVAGPIAAPMVGRRDEWERLMGAWHEAMENGPRLVLIDGAAGIGKTRLAKEYARWAEWQGAATASARCYAAEGEPAYAPVASWLGARPLPEAPDRQSLFQAMARALLDGRPHVAGSGHIPAGPQPLLLTIDDLQWCGPETLAWLQYLLRHDPGARLVVVGTVREEVEEEGPLPGWLRAVRHTIRAGGADVTEVALGPLDEVETQFLAADLAGGELDAGLADRLYAETGGNPLFVVEIVRAGRLVDAHAPVYPLQGLPARLQATIEDRLARLSPAAWDLAGLAAVVGRAFSYAVLERASELGSGAPDAGALLRALDELWRQRIVHEEGEGYDFAHDKLREVAYAGLDGARRQALHRRVAEALEALHSADLIPVSGQIAAHYEQGGQAARAIPYHLQAAEAALQVYADENAAGHCERALALAPSAAQRTEAKGLLQRAISMGRE